MQPDLGLNDFFIFTHCGRLVCKPGCRFNLLSKPRGSLERNLKAQGVGSGIVNWNLLLEDHLVQLSWDLAGKPVAVQNSMRRLPEELFASEHHFSVPGKVTFSA